jgi:hypothetical protein
MQELTSMTSSSTRVASAKDLVWQRATPSMVVPEAILVVVPMVVPDTALEEALEATQEEVPKEAPEATMEVVSRAAQEEVPGTNLEEAADLALEEAADLVLEEAPEMVLEEMMGVETTQVLTMADLWTRKLMRGHFFFLVFCSRNANV